MLRFFMRSRSAFSMLRHTVWMVPLLLFGPHPALGDEPLAEEATAATDVPAGNGSADDARLDALELEVLRLQATVDEADGEGTLKLKAFRGGQRSLQALNPEVSAVGDIFGRYLYSADGREAIGDERSGFFPRVLGLHLQANLDPFSFTKMAVAVSPGGAELGEMYATWTSVLPGVSVTAGKFRQQLGVVNRWHKPGLDQFDFPLMLTVPFTPGGMNQTGLSLQAVLPPLWCHGLELTVQVTNGSNPRVFAGDFFSVPATLAHFINYWDLSSSTYLELGLSGMLGFNNARNVVGDDGLVASEDWRRTWVGGADLTLSWEPLNRSKYHYFTWRSEFLYVQKELGDDTLRWMGGYSYLEYKLGRSWVIGTRGDLVQPFELNNGGQWDWQAVPYVTWWQSPWVRLRLEYDCYVAHESDPDHRVLLQFTFAAGPHKHERY